MKKARKASQYSNVITYSISHKISIMPKDIHPEWYDNTEVYCDGKLVYTVSSTKEKLNVDIWSGNHPFYMIKKLMDTVAGRSVYEKYNLEKNKLKK